MRFHLRKWYLDVISTDGDLHILYAATLKLGSLSVGYQSVLSCGAASVVPSMQTRFSAPLPPEEETDRLVWKSNELGLMGTWTRRAPCVEREVYRTESGAVSWRCMMPAANVILVARGVTTEGLGYAECLDVTFLPWELPIRELRWGRFVGPEGQAVWVDWQGGPGFRCMVVNGEDVRGEFDVHGLSGGHWALHWHESTLLRRGELGGNVLSALPETAKHVLPGQALRIHEEKWRSRGILEVATRPPDNGWVIHETVRWPAAQ